ncbi:hypothetical protein OSSY52_00090 [Tepiditoga spiralis]|uniref:Uncharacterized protein n=1 Tax=Tepiditoga spiralis TaxID=2108365 RepID=A0A7G1G171_9BACT|nr:hypothetical protein [Tepiditoga spiralis]BBE29868.1 hypothetical protein OSSY52_00090 [Tepiditoga spiralis]
MKKVEFINKICESLDKECFNEFYFVVVNGKEDIGNNESLICPNKIFCYDDRIIISSYNYEKNENIEIKKFMEKLDNFEDMELYVMDSKNRIFSIEDNIEISSDQYASLILVPVENYMEIANIK